MGFSQIAKFRRYAQNVRNDIKTKKPRSKNDWILDRGLMVKIYSTVTALAKLRG